MHKLTQTKFRDLMMHGKPGALCSTLIRLSNTYGLATDQGIHIPLKLTHSQLADYAGRARESVNRTLRSLKQAGAITIMDDRTMMITDLDYLQTASNVKYVQKSWVESSSKPSPTCTTFKLV
ncbi:helix-turn-helix domain-containing protein [Brevibacillus humidisoli]|uniref:helix-turn-helix domain-containing protein n=1 Tax=Brevibacillus humidisoli TaxID=2895522 RepID=UPI001E3DD7A3|nr:helix-turn-helix domain-containing protein [Brevibacillus humidisoli]UFJ41758.1 helix-turn-helix domain-containing protein [Brevibacillus humidisoli]